MEYVSTTEWNSLSPAMRRDIEKRAKAAGVSVGPQCGSIVFDYWGIGADDATRKHGYAACHALAIEARHAAIRAGAKRERTMLDELFTAMLRAGCNPGKVRVTHETLDATWGDLVGWRVESTDHACARRVAAWVHAYLTKHVYPGHNYNRQHGGGIRGEREVHTTDGVALRIDIGEAYYPCAD